MSNLLPPQARRISTYEYWARTVTVWAFLCAGAAIFSLVFLVPTFVLLRLEFAALGIEEDTLHEMHETADEAERSVTEIGALMSELARDTDAMKLSRVMEAIDATAGEDIALEQYLVERSDKKISTVHIEGAAQTRESLAAFEENLEAHALFAEADIPLSSLVRSQGLPFSVTITVADNVSRESI